MYKNIVSEIKRLSQEEGLKDAEIAEILECSRVTVNRIRNEHNIPTANLDNRRDKEYKCLKCKRVVKIRRSERRQLYCEKCLKIDTKS